MFKTTWIMHFSGSSSHRVLFFFKCVHNIKVYRYKQYCPILGGNTEFEMKFKLHSAHREETKHCICLVLMHTTCYFIENTFSIQ